MDSVRIWHTLCIAFNHGCMSHSNANKFKFSLNHEKHAFLTKFIAIIAANDIHKSSENSICAILHGYINQIDHNTCDNHIKNEGLSHLNSFNLQSNKVYIDQLRLSPFMTHDITLNIKWVMFDIRQLDWKYKCQTSTHMHMWKWIGNGKYTLPLDAACLGLFGIFNFIFGHRRGAFECGEKWCLLR